MLLSLVDETGGVMDRRLLNDVKFSYKEVKLPVERYSEDEDEDKNKSAVCDHDFRLGVKLIHLVYFLFVVFMTLWSTKLFVEYTVCFLQETEYRSLWEIIDDFGTD